VNVSSGTGLPGLLRTKFREPSNGCVCVCRQNLTNQPFGESCGKLPCIVRRTCHCIKVKALYRMIPTPSFLITGILLAHQANYALCNVCRFPLHCKSVLQQWLRNMRRENFTPTATSYLCGQHFRDDQFTDGSRLATRKCLKTDAIPTGMFCCFSIDTVFGYLFVLVIHVLSYDLLWMQCIDLHTSVMSIVIFRICVLLIECLYLVEFFTVLYLLS